MRRRALDLLVCPKCRQRLELTPFKDADRGAEIVEGVLGCTGCGARFPIVQGVPRLLPAALLGRMRPRYPEFFRAHPEFAGGDGVRDAVADTLESFTRQRLDLKPPGPEDAQQWRTNLFRNLGGALQGEPLTGKLILDVGCGFGRHLYVANEEGAETVGLDLSGGVDLAYANNRRFPSCHIVQASLFDRPLRDDIFDIVWSFGVLHHLPDPQAGFRAMVSFAKPVGGLAVIWVYGYEGMAFTYKLSHMRALHRVTRTMSDAARVRASKVVAGVLSGLYWEPLRLAKNLKLRRLVDRLPLSAYVDHPWMARVAGVHDRLSTPITHFHDLPELAGWFRDANLGHITVEDTNRRGWRAYGWRGGLQKPKLYPE